MEASLQEKLLRIYAETKTIAVVGASADETKAAHQIPRYLQSQGYRIIPVNPRGGKILGEPVFRSLADIDVPVDVVDVFRPPQEAPDIARQAIAIGAKVLWLQIGIESEEARQLAEAAGLTVIMNRCMGETHGELDLGPGPDKPDSTPTPHEVKHEDHA
ncbi:MAG TPA: CoA-binding protein [Ktedonobacteraceae bacterium]